MEPVRVGKFDGFKLSQGPGFENQKVQVILWLFLRNQDSKLLLGPYSHLFPHNQLSSPLFLSSY